MINAIAEMTKRLQTEIGRLQGEESLITNYNLERLVRSSQRLAICCRELWAASREDYGCFPSIALTSESACLPDWTVDVLADDLVEITLPLLLPKRTCPDASFITEPLERLMSAHHAKLPRFRRCCVLFRHIYGPELTVRDIRDHDNTESRKVLNVIERFLLTGDSADIHQTAQGDKTKTLILLAGSPNYMEGALRDEAYQRFADG